MPSPPKTLDQASHPPTEPEKRRSVDARQAQTGVVGDHAHIEGGAHADGDSGDFIGRDKHVHGDEVPGDKVAGDKIVYVDKRVQTEDFRDKELAYLTPLSCYSIIDIARLSGSQNALRGLSNSRLWPGRQPKVARNPG
jgi:hypothetical protein